MKQRILPKALKQGSTIGICSPAYFTKNEEIVQGVSVLQDMGFKTHIDRSVAINNPDMLSSIQERVDALHRLFENPNIDAIMFTRGGYGCPQLLEHLDFDLIAKNPKIVLGYSDIAVLLSAIQAKTGLITFQGPSVQYLSNKRFHPLTAESFYQTVTGNKTTMCLDKKPYQPTIVKGEIDQSIKAPFYGFNFVVMSCLVGTPYFLKPPEDGIICMESYQPTYFELDRVLHQYRYNGYLEGLKGLIFGQMGFQQHEMDKADMEYYKYELGPDKMLQHHALEAQLLMYDFPAGHEGIMLTSANCARYRFDIRKNGIDFTLAEDVLELI